MPEVRPFRALRYARVDNLSPILCPPYDVVSPVEEKRFLKRHPHNVVRLELPFRKEDGGRYTRAAQTLSKWKRQGILKEEPSPAFYILQTTFRHPLTGQSFTRSGFFGAVRVRPWGEGIYRHERTLPKPLLDRMKCLKAMRVQVSPIFGIFEDPRHESRRWLFDPSGEMIARATFPAGETHQLLRVSPSAQMELSRLLGRCRVVIADGHHRYETALAYAALQRKKKDASNHPGLFTLMYLCPDNDPGLPVFPTHRVVIERNNWLGRAQRFGSLKPYDSLDSLLHRVQKGGGWGIYERKNFFYQSDADGSSLAVQSLHETVLKGLQKKDMYFVQEPRQAVRLVDSRQAGAGFFLKALSVKEIISVATANDVLPPKSTYFYPKVPAGFVLYPVG